MIRVSRNSAKRNQSEFSRMAAEVKKEIELEIGHVLFIDIVGYSKLLITDQHASYSRS